MRIIDSTAKNNYFRQTGKYFIDKGIYLILLNLVPSLLLPFMISPSCMMYFLFDLGDVGEVRLVDVLVKMFDVSYSFWYIGIIGLVLMIFSIAISFGVIDRHMRVGEFTLSPSRVKSRLNYNILTAIRFGIAAFICVGLSNFLLALLYYLWLSVFKGIAARAVFCTLSFLAFETLSIILLSTLILWPPFMLHTGLRTGDAFKQAWRSVSGKVKHVALSIWSVVLPFQCVMIVTGMLGLGAVCHTLLDGVAYAVGISYYLTLMYNVFYDVTGTERMDIAATKDDIWSKK